ncbi:SCO7613 C-terminal domain-containing membrane protein [Actinoplanes friuliensis]|uniref:Uncharacterized protein n=1 Tax=Actinoplanes friuliensis DSM 7358 TaxID=1246995 RepID=U5VUD5_9ACTN|nr:hypothetical protein [Actinoplanes friuliensis]AGZ40563.1 hypothetical protein AFR_11370 [Actinoplanes friuliensis DSM 7358]
MTSYPCPSCRTPANLTTGCPGCGRGPDADAAEVVRLDAEIPVLTARVASAREAFAAADAALRRAWQLREAAVARIRASLAVPVPALAGPAPAPRTTETSTKLVQNVLFVLGGLLLGVAAIVFTAVAWAQFGVGGRALLLLAFTAAALTVPHLALRRDLRGTAETFAAIGLLLVLLDGYAAWYVNLFGVADYSVAGYAGAVCAVTAAIAAGYEHVTGLTGPRFAALLVAQPVLPLLAVPFHPDAAGWSFAFTAVAVLNLVIIHLRRSALTPLGVTAYGLGGVAVIIAGLSALTALAAADTTLDAGLGAAALVTASGAVLAGAILSRLRLAQDLAGGQFVVAVGLAAVWVSTFAGFLSPVLAAAVVTVLAVAVRVLPVKVRRGPWIGALVVSGVAAFAAFVFTVAGSSDWRLPAVIVLVTAAVVVLVPRGLQLHTVLGGAALLAATAPGSFDLLWWTAPGFDLVVVAAALALALRATPIWPAVVAALLTTHAVALAFQRPAVACATLTAVALLGLATAYAARRGSRVLGGVALVIGLLAVPAAAWQGAAALSLSAAVQSRVALAAAALLVGAVHLGGRGYRPFALVAALLGVVSAPAWAMASGDSPAIYAATGLLLVALTVSTTIWARLAALPLGLVLITTIAPSLYAVLVRPYAWLGKAWSGVPSGTGVGTVATADVAALGVFAVAVVIAVQTSFGRRAAVWAVAPVLAVLMSTGFAVTGVPWPGVPAESLVIGLAGLLAVALLRATHFTAATPSEPGARRPSFFGAGGFGAARAGVLLTGAALTGAGLAGALATQGATLAALALCVVAGGVAGVSGRFLAARVTGWLFAATAVLAFAFTAARSAELPLPTAAFAVLGAAFVVFVLGTALAFRRTFEAKAVQAAAHAGAFVALLFTTGSIRHSAAIFTFWGLALGLRALRPGETPRVRRGHVIAAAVAELAAWWLLIAAERVATVEAYTLPAAAVALLIGWLTRRKERLSSWVTYGPALAAALLPTLASVLTDEGVPLRRLLLGLAALAVLLAGARARLQAPVVAGGGVLAVVALHELVLVWDLLPRWIPLALAGLLLVALAMTLERRRRDLARVRAALTRMS